MERLITKYQERIYRLRHHHFGCLDTKTVAKMLGITCRSINRQMQKMKQIAPQLFPILTKQQSKIYDLFVSVGLPQKVIAEMLNVSENCVGVILYRFKQKGMYIPQKRHHVLYMPKIHDHQIKQKF